MVSILWIIFTVTFAVLSGTHLWLATQDLPRFVLNPEGERRAAKISGISTGYRDTVDFTEHFNTHVDKCNSISRSENRLAAGGYALASLTALMSLLLSLGCL